MGIEKAKEFFKKRNLESRIREFETSSATVELAAAALGCGPERIAKSLSFKVDGKGVLIVTAGNAKVDNAKFKMQFHTKATMLSKEEVTDLIGYDVGGVCPFGINEGVDVYIDISLKSFATVFPACGSSNSVIELTIDELEKYSNSIAWIDVCKNWRNNVS